MYCDGQLISGQRFPSPHPSVELSVITYWAGGLKVKGLLAEPAGKVAGDGFLYLRGGMKNAGKVRPGRIIQFACEGFIVFAPYYRGNEGGEGNEDFAGEDRIDAFAAFKFIENHPRVKRVHIFGFSRGGVMALFTGLQFPRAASLVTWGGVSDMFLTYEEREDLRRMMKRVIGGTPEKYPQRYYDRSPLFHLENLQVPVLIIHGKKDRHVSVEQAHRLESRLKLLNKEVECWYFSDFTHYFPPKENRRVVRNLCQWMKQKSKGRGRWQEK